MHDYTKQRPRGCGRQNGRHNRRNTMKSIDEFIQRKTQRERCLRRSTDIQNKMIMNNQEIWNFLIIHNKEFWN